MTVATSTVTPRPMLPTLGLPRTVAYAVWLGWLTVVVLSLTVAAAAFVQFIRTGGDEVLLQGPLQVNPAIADQLELLFGNPGFLRDSQLAIHVLGFVVFAGTAALVAARRRASLVPLLGSAMLVLVGTSLFAPVAELDGAGWNAVTRLVGTFSLGVVPRYWASLAGLSLIAFFFVFPDGRWVPSWGRWVAAVLGGMTVLVLFAPRSPLDPAQWPTSLRGAWSVAIPVGAVGAQAYRAVRTGGGADAVQGRPVVVSFGVATATFLVIWVLQPELTEGLFGLVLVTPRMSAIYDLNLLVFLTGAVLLFPVSIWFAVARYGLFDIDLIVNRALVYGTITALIAAAFFGVGVTVVLLAGGGLGDRITGPQAGVTGAIAGAAFVVAFQPLRRRVQRIVDRRFYREKYDADQAVEAFAARATDEVDLMVLEEEVAAVVRSTLHPEGVTVWLPRPEADEPFGGGARAALLDLGSPALTSRVADIPGVGKGHEVIVPLISQHELVGALLLGPRLGGLAYSGLDLELLDKLAHRAAPSFRMAQLVRRQEHDMIERERVAQELDIARRIQLEMLPKQLPEMEGWEVDVYYQPAREVGGDFYDFIPFDDGTWAVVVGDVAGKGVPAAMVMTTCRTLLRGATGDGERSPGAVLARVNELLRPDIPDAMFVTCLYGILDPGAGTFVFANAGHDLPFLHGDAGVRAVRARGMPLGLLPGMEYEEAAASVGAGDTIVFSSDGLAESHDPSGEMFGTPRIADVIGLSASGSDVIARLLDVHRVFTGPEWEQEDDVTLLAIHRTRG